MKLANILTAAVVGLTLPAVWALSQSSAVPLAEVAPLDNRLTLSLALGRRSYLPGEPIPLKFDLRNASERPVAVLPGLNVQEGRLRLFVSYAGGPYQEYLGPQWGTADTFYTTARSLAPGEALTGEATLLYNLPLATAHLNPETARNVQEREKRIATTYALERPGRYRLQAVLFDPEYRRRISAAPVEIEIRQPAGREREVWEVLRRNPDLGYFMQVGSARTAPASPTTRRVLETLERLSVEYPDSPYAPAIARSLESYRQVLQRQQP